MGRPREGQDRVDWLQATYDRIVHSLMRQGCGSYVSGTYFGAIECVYRGPDGTKCAAGFLIPDSVDVYERESIRNLHARGVFGDVDLYLLMEMQRAHDFASQDALYGGDFRACFSKYARDAAKRFGLEARV